MNRNEPKKCPKCCGQMKRAEAVRAPHFSTLESYNGASKTKDPYYVKQFLGHKSLRSTEVYITIERALFESTSDEFTVRVVERPEEAKALLEAGFDYVCQKDNLIFLRKRK